MNAETPLLTREEFLNIIELTPQLRLALAFCLRESCYSLGMRATMTPASLIVGFDYSHILTFLQQLVAANTLDRHTMREMLGTLEQRVPVPPRTNVSDEVNPNKRKLEVQ